MAFKVVDILGLSAVVDYEEMFRQAGVDVELVRDFCSFESTEDDIVAAIGDADAVIAQATYQPFSREVLSRLENCKLIMSAGIGFDRLDTEAATEYGIMAANAPDFCLEEVSDHTMALILCCTRRITQINDIVKAGGWKSQPDPRIGSEIWPKMTRLKGKTLGLLGFGRIPQTLEPKAKGFGLRIIVYDPYVSRDSLDSFEVEQVGLDELLAQSDIISIHVPLNSETRHMLGMEQLRKMKPSACLVNTARGAIADHEALYTALSEGIISMAAFDVTEPEPIPSGSPLLKLDNFVVTGHSAHAFSSSSPGLFQRPAEEVIRVARGEWPVGLVNPAVKGKYNLKWSRA